MAVRNIRKYSDDNVIIASGASPEAAGIGVKKATSIARTGGSGILKFSADGVTAQEVADGHWGSKTIADGSATSLFNIPLTAKNYAGGVIFFDVQASDGTDFQSFTGMTMYAGVNKAGTITTAITDASCNDAKALSTGTLTLSWTATDDTNIMTIKLQPTGSLTETTFICTYFVLPIMGVPNIL